MPFRNKLDHRCYKKDLFKTFIEAFVIVWYASFVQPYCMSFSHFDLVLGNYEPNVDQTLLELFLYIWIFNKIASENSILSVHCY